MNANELMIGDWVYSTHHKNCIKITAYDFFTHHHNNDGTQSFKGIIEPMPKRGFDLEPIPLTAEILEKNGDVKGLCTFRDNGKGKKCYALKYLPTLNLYFVHTLQHALRLCGLTELEDNFKV